jgi:hypothetical protein
MASRKTRHRKRLTLALTAMAAAAIWLFWGRREAPPTDFGTPTPAASLPQASLPFDPPEDLHYVFGWNGVPAATLRMTTTRASEAADSPLVVEYEVRSLPAIQALWQLEATGHTLLDQPGLRPQHAVFRKSTKDKETTYETTFDWPAGVARVVVHKVRKGREKDKALSLGIGLDIPSAFLALRAAGAGQSVRVVHGDDAYQVVVADRGREPVELADGVVDALHYEVGVRKLEDADEEEPAAGPGFSSAHVWLEPGTRKPLRLEARAFRGQVYAERTPPPSETDG